MLKGFGWTDERIEQLRGLHADGLTLNVISSRMGCTRGQVSGKLHRLGLMIRQVEPRRKPKPKPTPANPLMRPRAPEMIPQPWADFPKAHRASEASAPCTDDTRIHDIAPQAGGVLWIDTPAGGCLWPMNEIKPIREHRRCGAHRVKSGLPGDPYCAEHSRMALKTPPLPTSKGTQHGQAQRIIEQTQDQR